MRDNLFSFFKQNKNIHVIMYSLINKILYIVILNLWKRAKNKHKIYKHFIQPLQYFNCPISLLFHICGGTHKITKHNVSTERFLYYIVARHQWFTYKPVLYKNKQHFILTLNQCEVVFLVFHNGLINRQILVYWIIAFKLD